MWQQRVSFLTIRMVTSRLFQGLLLWLSMGFYLVVCTLMPHYLNMSVAIYRKIKCVEFVVKF